MSNGSRTRGEIVGEDLRALLRRNCEFRIMWMRESDGTMTRYEMPKETSMKWFYVSFAGDEGFRGVVHIDAADEDAVLERTNELKLNPGGQMLILEIPEDIAEKVVAHGYERRLLTEDDLHALDRLIEGEDSPGPKALRDLTEEETANVEANLSAVICDEHNNALDVKVKTP